MKILDAGHEYELDVYDGDQYTAYQTITFMKREGEGFPFNNSFYPGTNCQEVLRVLIDRCEYLQKQKPCLETESIIGMLKTSLMLFEIRAARLHKLSINLDYNTLNDTCKECGHIVCDHRSKAIPENTFTGCYDSNNNPIHTGNTVLHNIYGEQKVVFKQGRFCLENGCLLPGSIVDRNNFTILY
jgi:hypothetical protein